MVRTPGFRLSRVAPLAVVLAAAVPAGAVTMTIHVIGWPPTAPCADGTPAKPLANAIRRLRDSDVFGRCRAPADCARSEAKLDAAFDEACAGDERAALSSVTQAVRRLGLRDGIGSTGGGDAVALLVDAALAVADAKGAEALDAVDRLCRSERPSLEPLLERARDRLDDAVARTPRDGRAAALLASEPLARALGVLDRVAASAESARARCFARACRSDGAALFEPGPESGEPLELVPPERGDVAVYRVTAPPLRVRYPRTSSSGYSEPDLFHELGVVLGPGLGVRPLKLSFDGPGRVRVSEPPMPVFVPRLPAPPADASPLATRVIATEDCVDSRGWVRSSSVRSTPLEPRVPHRGGDATRVRIAPASAVLPSLLFGPMPPRAVRVRVGDSLVEPAFGVRTASPTQSNPLPLACSGSHRVVALEEIAGPDGPLRAARVESHVSCSGLYDEDRVWWLASGVGFVRAELPAPGGVVTYQLVCFETPDTPGRCDSAEIGPEP